MSGGGRTLGGETLIIASHNPGKVSEIADLLAPFGTKVLSAAELDLPEPVEDGASFEANALIKARAAAKGGGLPALADDSGLVVAALGGEPGIHSARWAGPDKDFGLAMERVEAALKKTGIDPDDPAGRRAHFACVLAVAWPDGETLIFEGRVEGHLVWPPRGDKGFGYDPVFVADGHEVTFAEMAPSDKHRISHRADAFSKLVANCFDSETI